MQYQILEEVIPVFGAGFIYGLGTTFLLPINYRVIGLKLITMRVMWVIFSTASYALAVQLAIITESALLSGFVGGAVLLFGIVLIMKWSRTQIRLFVLLLLPVVGAVTAQGIPWRLESIVILYVAWQCLVSIILMLGIKSTDDTKKYV